MARRGHPEVIKVSCGPIEPLNDRMRLKLLVSDELRKRKGVGTSQDKVEHHLNRKYGFA